jgi:hypothetical protein
MPRTGSSQPFSRKWQFPAADTGRVIGQGGIALRSVEKQSGAALVIVADSRQRVLWEQQQHQQRYQEALPADQRLRLDQQHEQQCQTGCNSGGYPYVAVSADQRSQLDHALLLLSEALLRHHLFQDQHAASCDKKGRKRARAAQAARAAQPHTARGQSTDGQEPCTGGQPMSVIKKVAEQGKKQLKKLTAAIDQLAASWPHVARSRWLLPASSAGCGIFNGQNPVDGKAAPTAQQAVARECGVRAVGPIDPRRPRVAKGGGGGGGGSAPVEVQVQAPLAQVVPLAATDGVDPDAAEARAAVKSGWVYLLLSSSSEGHLRAAERALDERLAGERVRRLGGHKKLSRANWARLEVGR